jgi:hypothetical protein
MNKEFKIRKIIMNGMTELIKSHEKVGKPFIKTFCRRGLEL